MANDQNRHKNKNKRRRGTGNAILCYVGGPMAEQVACIVENITTKLGKPFVLCKNGVRLHATIAVRTGIYARMYGLLNFFRAYHITIVRGVNVILVHVCACSANVSHSFNLSCGALIFRQTNKRGKTCPQMSDNCGCVIIVPNRLR